MTRWARLGGAKQKRESEATPWSLLRKDDSFKKKQGFPKYTNRKSKNRNVQGRTESESDNSDDEGRGAELKSGTASSIQKPRDTKRRQGLLASLMPDAETSNFRQEKKDESSDTSDDEKDAGVAALLQNEPTQSKSVFPVKRKEIDEIEEAVRKDRRREQRRLKRIDHRQAQMVCFNCRQPGHDVANCPKIQEDSTQGIGICFKCGSTEHSINQCYTKLPPGVFPYARCFICNETGHLSKQCPDNPRGLYPNGGSCNACGSVEHYRRDCPEVQKKQGINNMKLFSWDSDTKGSVDDDLYDSYDLPGLKPKKRKKIVKF